MLSARLRAPCGWSNASILNVSSRGLMINATVGALKSGKVELWHGEHVIVGTVVWRKGTRAGLRADERIPVEDIMALSYAPSLQLTAADRWPQKERRKKPRDPHESQQRARAMQFVGIAFVGASLAIGGAFMVTEAMSRPMSLVGAALERSSGAAPSAPVEQRR